MHCAVILISNMINNIKYIVYTGCSEIIKICHCQVTSSIAFVVISNDISYIFTW